MEKKNLLVRIFVPVVVAGMVFVGLPACFQDDGYPEGFVLNDEAGVATMAKRSMPQGGESIKPIEPEKPSYKYGEATVTFNPNRSLEKASCHFLMTAIRKTALYMLDS